ncbi:MAG: hypothetical protein Q7S68_04810 [Deltaproteobacteria bacterium]|nr:hypothetical protein [Deltaproteobacteria bacterium]
MKKIMGLVLMIFVFGVPAFADSPSPYGPEGKRFGAGLYLGEPTGFTFKGYLSERLAINGIAGWALRNEAFTVIGDGLYEFLDIPVDSDVITLPFYAGAGAKLSFNGGRNDNTMVGIRIPVGVAVQWINHPFETFAEIVPGMEVIPSTRVDLMGGIGIRFYF